LKMYLSKTLLFLLIPFIVFHSSLEAQPPVLTIAGPAGTICSGAKVTLVTSVTNNPAITGYEWVRGGTPLGVNAPTYTASDFVNVEQVYATINYSGPGGTTLSVNSNTVTIMVSALPAPTIQISSDAQPVVCSSSGIPVNFTATVTNAGGAPVYQWQVNGNPAPGGTNSFLYSSATLSNGDVVTCVYSDNTACVVPGPNVSNAITMQVISPVTPSVTIASDALTICASSPATFTATPLNGGTNPVYQWQVNNSPAPGGTNSATYTSSGLNDMDVVRCLLTSNAACLTTPSAFSNSFSMSVNPTLVSSVSLAYTPTSICAGDKVVFTATPTNEGTAPDYVWQVNGNPAPGATNSLTYSSNTLADGDVVSIGLSDAVGCVTSSTDQATVTVNPLPTVANGQLIVLSKGESATLELVTTGTIASYVWSPVTGLSDATIATPVATPLGTTTYTLLVTTPAGCTASGSVTVKVYTDLAIPNAFTPNGDGHNDVFFVIGGPRGSQIKEFVVFDRWGQRVFQVQNVLPDDRNFGWNGRVNGNDAPAGAYVYQIRMGFADGTQQVYKGTVLLVR
jgi:gliding motility-associated-like protein